eukprot:12407779-Karenia_brevis.AAC.1
MDQWSSVYVRPADGKVLCLFLNMPLQVTSIKSVCDELYEPFHRTNKATYHVWELDLAWMYQECLGAFGAVVKARRHKIRASKCAVPAPAAASKAASSSSSSSSTCSSSTCSTACPPVHGPLHTLMDGTTADGGEEPPNEEDIDDGDSVVSADDSLLDALEAELFLHSDAGIADEYSDKFDEWVTNDDVDTADAAMQAHEHAVVHSSTMLKTEAGEKAIMKIAAERGCEHDRGPDDVLLMDAALAAHSELHGAAAKYADFGADCPSSDSDDELPPPPVPAPPMPFTNVATILNTWHSAVKLGMDIIDECCSAQSRAVANGKARECSLVKYDSERQGTTVTAVDL